ncbi:MAG: DUF814 domain-containing protein [Bdellovibrionia bacterium]
MKALNQVELNTLVEHLSEEFAGAQLQDVLVNDRGLLLEFYKNQSLWLLLDFNPVAPLLLDFKERPYFVKGASKPVSLFLKAHGEDLLWKGIEILSDFGRVVRVYLANKQKVLEMEVRLIPRQANLILKTEDKTIAWAKPRELEVHQSDFVAGPNRDVVDLRNEWKQSMKSPQASTQAVDPVQVWEKKRAKDIAKKRKAIEEIQDKLNDEQSSKWRELGVWLQSGAVGDNPAPELYQQLSVYDKLGVQLEKIFAKVKQAENKRAGTLERLNILKDEILKLENAKYAPSTKVAGKTSLDLMAAASARGRKLNLSSEAVAYLGKSAADNLALLRKAKAWDLWVHLRDYPSAHVIIHKKKDQIISHEEFEQVARWLARETLSQKMLQLGQKIEVIAVECRFVRPIKGDKVGRVQYHSEKSIFVTL